MTILAWESIHGCPIRGEDTKRNSKHVKPVLKVLFVWCTRPVTEASRHFDDPM